MGQALGTIGQILPGAMAVKNAFSGPQAKSSGQLANVNNAIINPQNPLYAQLYGQNKQNNLNSLSQAIAEMERQNRSLAANGRVPLFAQGREGEQAFRTLTQGYQGLDQNARNATLQQLQAGAGGLSGQVLPASKSQTNLELGGYSDISDLLKKLGGGQQQTTPLTAPSNEQTGNPYNLPWKGYASAN